MHLIVIKKKYIYFFKYFRYKLKMENKFTIVSYLGFNILTTKKFTSSV